MPHNKKLPAELKVMERMALTEQLLAKLKLDFESAGFRRNRIVDDGITSGFEEIDVAVEKLAEDDLEEADRACKVAWLHGHFARGIFDAETTEHYLGEGVFLEIEDEIGDWQKFAHDEIISLEEEIVKFRKELKKKLEK